eukprot:CAMPEP_0118633178 /NCGR_PEP_ID=MMETSP0785-20121206/853_1 /TAXON_ID=91992 /ORGANISM="Bolidomonas pacifica, Strain CCMP 1866" /LENGTH=744 /DNA_ID=CAMNT_0006524025 /DNA_START=48 /DNA_END=2278 /DNA_ORIENTATION=-
MSDAAVRTLVKVREHAEAEGGFNLKAAFAKFDVDGDGSISHEELTTVLLSIVPDLAYDQILAVISMFDPNHDGDIAYVEFAHTFYNAEVNDNTLKARKAMVRIRKMASSKRGFHLREAFQRFDKDGDGSVSHDELKVVINDILQGDISEEEMVAVIELFDPDNDGDIKYAEFRDLFYSISVDQEKERDVCDHRGKDIDDDYIEISLIPHLMRDEYSHLLLSNNNISDAGAEEIAMALEGDKAHVSVIDLRNNKIGVKGAEHLGDALGSNVYIMELYLSNNPIMGVGASHLCRSLEPTNAGFSAISLLDLRNCDIDDNGGEGVGMSFRGNTALRNISLCGNYLGDKSATAIAEALQNERCMIQSLNLSNNKIGGQGGKMIGYSIRSNVELKELILSGNPLGDLGVSSFAESMEGVEAPEGMDEKKDAYEDSGRSKKERKEAANESKSKQEQKGTAYCGLRILGVSGCSITDNGLADLGGALRTNAVLQTIDIRCNNLTDVGITSLARSLEENTCMRELYCGNNNFGTPAATALGSALHKNCSLLVLDVAGCNLGKGNAAKMLAEGLLKNECLHELSISRTHLTDEGVNAFIAAIEQNQCLEKIIFHNNPITKSSIAALNFAMTRERKPAAKLLDNMESLRLKHKAEIKKRELDRKIKAAAEAGEAGDEALESIKRKTQEVLEPGTKIWIPVSFGRRNNILGKIEVESHTSLADARVKIERFGDLGDEYVFISINDGKPIDKEEEA